MDIKNCEHTWLVKFVNSTQYFNIYIRSISYEMFYGNQNHIPYKQENLRIFEYNWSILVKRFPSITILLFSSNIYQPNALNQVD